MAIIVYAVILHNRGQLKIDNNNHITLVSQLSCQSVERINVSTFQQNATQTKQVCHQIKYSTKRFVKLRRHWMYISIAHVILRWCKMLYKLIREFGLFAVFFVNKLLFACISINIPYTKLLIKSYQYSSFVKQQVLVMIHYNEKYIKNYLRNFCTA